MINPMSKVNSWVYWDHFHGTFANIFINYVVKVFDPPFNSLLKFFIVIKIRIALKRLVDFIKLLVFLSASFRYKFRKLYCLKCWVSILVVNSIPCKGVIKVWANEDSGVRSSNIKLVEQMLYIRNDNLDDRDLRTHETRKKQ